MNVFVTGAAGFIGSALVPKLLKAGHTVTGLARSEQNAKDLTAAGAKVHRGNIEDLDSIRSGAKNADAVIHLAFNHDFSNFQANCDTDRRVIETLGSVLEGSKRPLIVTSGTAIAPTPGRSTTEDDAPNSPFPRVASEKAAEALAQRGLHVSVVRLAQIHDTRKQGLVTFLVAVAREKNLCAYIGEGRNRWPACPLDSTAELYKLVLEKGEAGKRYNAVQEEGVSMREITETLARGLNLPAKSIAPEQAAEHFGWLAHFATADIPASSALTQQRLNWHPTGPSLITDLQNMNYATA
jgi:nucleoside-diphosphate-sugar epimerase